MATNKHFYFAWVAPTDKTWSTAFARNDEAIFSLEVGEEEGKLPTLTVRIKNPNIGLLSPGRQVWAWLSETSDGGATVTPRFFGRLIGVPKTVVGKMLECSFVARAVDYVQQKQRLAETLKVLPAYDPLFYDLLKRDDPDAILEGYSSRYVSDRVTGQVYVTDVLTGEEGTIVLAPSDVFYPSVKMTLQQTPLTAISIKCQVGWKQQFTGFFNLGSWSYPTLGAEPFVDDWPKSGAAIGGGYSGAISWAGIIDPYIGTPTSSNAGATYHWQNTQRHHEYGDTMSIDYSYSVPTMSNMMMFTTLYEDHAGVLDPYATDAGGNPAPVNDPAWGRLEQVGVRKFSLDFAGRTAVATLGIRYDANRERYERLDMTIEADVQPILVDPLVIEDTETMTFKCGDLAVPVTNLLNWSSIAGTSVALGTVIFPDNPRIPGQTSSQIAVTAGTAGLIEPIFSNIAGVTTNDGGVVWSSLGDTPPSDSVQDWRQLARVSLGTIILPRPISGSADIASLLALSNLGFNSHGIATAKYTIYAENMGEPGDTMLECIQAGMYGGLALQSIFDAINNNVNAGFIYWAAGAAGIDLAPPDTSPTNRAIFETFINPSGKSLYIAVQAGVTGEFHTTFNDTPGALTSDGSVIWQCLGAVSLPIGGWPGMTPAKSFFDTDRGKLSLEHMICRGRAKLRRRARAVQISFQCRYDAVADAINCRKNITIFDRRLPGQQATGKIISYKLRRDGSTQQTIAEVVMGCAVGNGPSSSGSTSVAGTGVLAVSGLFADGVQVMSGAVAPLTTSPLDIGYTPPVAQIVDDGLNFPLFGVGDCVMVDQWHGIASTLNPANIAAYNAAIAATIADLIAGAKSSQQTATGSVTVPTTNWADLAAQMASKIAKITGQGTGLWYELVMRNLTSGPYSQSYVAQTTKLAIEKHIDLLSTSGG